MPVLFSGNKDSVEVRELVLEYMKLQDGDLVERRIFVIAFCLEVACYIAEMELLRMSGKKDVPDTARFKTLLRNTWKTVSR